MLARRRRNPLCLAVALLVAAAIGLAVAPALDAAPTPQGPPPPPASQQPPPPAPGPSTPQAPPADRPLRLFIDCSNVWCDDTFFRSEVSFVDHVRDRRDADVHALITGQATGGGGREYSITLIGLGRFEKVEHTLRYVAKATDTNDITRRGLVRTLKLGLVRYVAETAAGGDLQVTYQRPKGAATVAARDPWNYWTFRSSLSARGSGEESNSSLYVSGSLTANRVTDAWKIETGANASYSTDSYTFSEGDSYTSHSRSSNVGALVVKSLNAHWSAGGRGAVSSSTYLNQALKARLAPAIEYNLFPYSESTRRQFTINYSVGANHFKFRETTIYGRDRQMLVDHRVLATLDLRQPWGTTSTSFQASQFLSDPSKTKLELEGEVDVRLFKGFSLSGWCSISRVHDQIYLPRGEATAEEVLVRQRQLATSYQYYASIGFSYRFGSIYNNVVNSRFKGF